MVATPLRLQYDRVLPADRSQGKFSREEWKKASVMKGPNGHQKKHTLRALYLAC